MATPYLQVKLETVTSTQDEARDRFEAMPVVVIASGQTRGRGRTGAIWRNADRALAVSVAHEVHQSDMRPFSLMAGIAAARSTPGLGLKWPNDVLAKGVKVGGILVEKSGQLVVTGFGLNLWWPDAPQDAGGVFGEDPGESRHFEQGALWAAEYLRLVGESGWPRDEYCNVCRTIGEDIVWEPDGSGRAVDVGEDGSLIVETGGGRAALHSGAVAHVRTQPRSSSSG